MSNIILTKEQKESLLVLFNAKKHFCSDCGKELTFDEFVDCYPNDVFTCDSCYESYVESSLY